MARPRALRVVLLSSRETLPGLGPALRSAGVRFHRVVAIVPEACRPRPLGGPIPPTRSVDTVLVTSRHAVGPALRAWTRPQTGGATPEIWAAGPGTAERLRRAGVRRLHIGSGAGAGGIVQRLGGRPRTIVHVRSDLAGDSLARELRERGHRVVEIVAYRVRPALSEIRRRRLALLDADVLILTSPSVVSALHDALGSTRVRELARRKTAIVLGGRTARAAEAAGFHPVVVPPTTTPQRFARRIVRSVIHASA